MYIFIQSSNIHQKKAGHSDRVINNKHQQHINNNLWQCEIIGLHTVKRELTDISCGGYLQMLFWKKNQDSFVSHKSYDRIKPIVYIYWILNTETSISHCYMALSFINCFTQNKGSLSDFHGWPAAGLRRPRPQRQGSLWLTLITATLVQESGLRMISHQSG